MGEAGPEVDGRGPRGVGRGGGGGGREHRHQLTAGAFLDNCPVPPRREFLLVRRAGIGSRKTAEGIASVAHGSLTTSPGSFCLGCADGISGAFLDNGAAVPPFRQDLLPDRVGGSGALTIATGENSVGHHTFSIYP